MSSLHAGASSDSADRLSFYTASLKHPPLKRTLAHFSFNVCPSQITKFGQRVNKFDTRVSKQKIIKVKSTEFSIFVLVTQQSNT